MNSNKPKNHKLKTQFKGRDELIVDSETPQSSKEDQGRTQDISREHENSRRQGLSSTKIRPGTPSPRKNSAKEKQRPDQTTVEESDVTLHSNNDQEPLKDIKEVDSALADAEDSPSISDINLRREHKKLMKKFTKNCKYMKPAEGSGSLQSELEESFRRNHETKHMENQSSSKKPEGVLLGVHKGNIFIPSMMKPITGRNNFADYDESKIKQAKQKWILDLDDFRDEEITLRLFDRELKIEGDQIQHDNRKTFTEVIKIPKEYNVEHLKIIRNPQMGNVVLAYVEKHKLLHNWI